MTNRHAALYLAFGLPIAGALAASYLHLAAWLQPWMPPGWERLSWVAALALDGLILAPIVARQIVGADVSGMALRLAQGTGIGASVYVNARWGWQTMPPVTRWDMADVAVGAAILPLLALIGEHAMRATLAAMQAQKPQPARVVTAAAPAKRQPKAALVAAPVTQRGTAAELAAAEGVSLRTAYRRLAARDMADGAPA